MNEDTEPPGRQTLRTFLAWEVDGQMHDGAVAIESLRDDIVALRGPIVPATEQLLASLPSLSARAAYVHATEGWEDIRRRCRDGELVAWGTTTDSISRRVATPAELWSKASCSDLEFGQVQLESGASYVDVRLFSPALLKEWQEGVEIERALQLIDPLTHWIYRGGRQRRTVSGQIDVVEKRRREEAGDFLWQSLADHIQSGKILVCCWHPPSEPTGDWKPVSEAVRKQLGRSSLDAANGGLVLPTVGMHDVLLFWRPPPPAKKGYLQERIHLTLLEMPPEKIALAKKRGGKKKLAAAMLAHPNLSGECLESVLRLMPPADQIPLIYKKTEK